MRATIKELEKETKDMSDIDGQITRAKASLKAAKQQMDADRAKAEKEGKEFNAEPYKKGTQVLTNHLVTLKDQKAKSNKSKKNESTEIEESKELPKKIELHEGMSIADKFKALM